VHRLCSLFAKESTISESKTKKSADRSPDGVFQVWERRTQLVKAELAAASAATDAKTIRLRALRLAKEAEDAEAAAEAAKNAPPAPAKRTKRTTTPR
jgi:hypothetical protein